MHVKFLKKGMDSRFFTREFTNPLSVSDNIKFDDYTDNISEFDQK